MILLPSVLAAVTLTEVQLRPPLPVEAVRSIVIESQLPTAAGADATTVGATALEGARIVNTVCDTASQLLIVLQPVAVAQAALIAAPVLREREPCGAAHASLPLLPLLVPADTYANT